MNPTIRQATRQDGPVIAQFNALMAQETEHRSLDHRALRHGVEAVLADSSKGIYYVAEVEGHVVGQLLLTYEWSDWRSGVFWWIQSVFVREEYRGKGIFKAMYRHVQSLARKDPEVCGLRLYVDGGNERARKTYERLGMNKTSYELYEVDFVLDERERRR
ncbi:MAG: GNAT family N-acetyltransferase [Ignavibacteriales bacterium]|nr:GNAT family N-acetyltransferase [Ignavibacteriales bacterium]